MSQYVEDQFRNNLEFRKSYIEEMNRLQLAYKIAQLRKAKHLTQAELARRIHTKQQTISRLEDVKNTRISFKTLSKIAIALKARLTIDLVPQP